MKAPTVFLCVLLCSLLGAHGLVIRGDGNQTELTIETNDGGDSSSDNYSNYPDEGDSVAYNDTYSYDEGDSEEEEAYYEYKLGESNYDNVAEDDNSNVEVEADDDNCMKIESYLMTTELEDCCVILEANSTTRNDSASEVEKCVLLQMYHIYGLASDVNVEDQATMRRVYGPACTIIGNWYMMKQICCLYNHCHHFNAVLLRSMCHACSNDCVRCGGPNLH